jgi:RHS repeat-associated protein
MSGRSVPGGSVVRAAGRLRRSFTAAVVVLVVCSSLFPAGGGARLQMRPASSTADTYAWVATTQGFLELDDVTSGTVVESLPVAVAGANALGLDGIPNSGQGENAIAVSPDGRWIFVEATIPGSEDANGNWTTSRNVELAYSPGTGDEVLLPLPGAFVATDRVLFSPDGRTADLVYSTPRGQASDGSYHASGTEQVAVVSLAGPVPEVTSTPFSFPTADTEVPGPEVDISADGSQLYFAPGSAQLSADSADLSSDPKLYAISTADGTTTTPTLDSPCAQTCGNDWQLCSVATVHEQTADPTILASFIAEGGGGRDAGVAEFDLDSGAVLNVQDGAAACSGGNLLTGPGSAVGIASVPTASYSSSPWGIIDANVASIPAFCGLSSSDCAYSYSQPFSSDSDPMAYATDGSMFAVSDNAGTYVPASYGTVDFFSPYPGDDSGPFQSIPLLGVDFTGYVYGARHRGVVVRHHRGHHPRHRPHPRVPRPRGAGHVHLFSQSASSTAEAASLLPAAVAGVAFEPTGIPIGGFVNAEPAGGGCGAAEHFGGGSAFDAACQSASEVGGLGPLGVSVSMESGNLSLGLSQLSLPGPGSSGFGLSESYNSLAAVSASSPGPLGSGWSLGLGDSISVATDGSVTATAGDGAEVLFTPAGGNDSCPSGEVASSSSNSTDLTFCAPPRVDASLVGHADGSFTYVIDNTTTEQFDSGGQILSSTDPDGNSVSYSYTGGELTGVSNSAGRSLALSYFPDGELETVTEPSLSRQVSFSYFPDGELETVTDPKGNVTSFSYDGSLELTGAVAPDDQASGASTVVAYDPTAPGVVASVTDPLSLETQFSFAGAPESAVGGSAAMTDPHGNKTVDLFSWGELDSSTTGAGSLASQTTLFGYDPATTMLNRVRDPHGGLTNAAYDSSGDLTCEASPDETAAGASCNPGGTPYVAGTQGYTYNAFHEVLTATSPTGVTTTNAYGGAAGYDMIWSLEAGAPGTTPAAPSLTTQYAYYSNGDLACEASAAEVAGGVHCPSSPVPGSLSAIPGATTYRYDAARDVTSVTDPDGNTTNMTYDAEGEVVCSASGLSGATCLPAGSTQPVAATRTTYDADGNTSTVTTPATTAAPSGATTTDTYGANGNLTEVDAPGASGTTTTITTYDRDNRPHAVTTAYGTADAATTVSSYDLTVSACEADTPDASPSGVTVPPPPAGASYCTVTEQPEGGATPNPTADTVDYYDASDRLVEEVQPAARSASTDAWSVSDCPGMPSTEVYCDSTTDVLSTPGFLEHPVTYTGYDANGQVVGVTYRNPAAGAVAASDVTYTWNLDGTRRDMQDGTGTTRYGYDSLGRLVQVTNGAGTNTTYGYDRDGNETCVSYPVAPPGPSCADTGTTTGTGLVDYTYDQADLMGSVTDWNGKTTTFTPDADGNTATTAYPNGVTVASSYDNTDAMISTAATKSTTALAGISYQRYQDGSVSSEANSGALATSAAYGYTARGALSCELATSSPPPDVTCPQSGSGSSRWSYNTDGDPQSLGAAAQQFSSADQLQSSTVGSIATTYGYDGAGQRTSLSPPELTLPDGHGTIQIGSAAQYSYDEAGRLASVGATGRLTGRMAVSANFSAFVEPDGSLAAAGSDSLGELGTNGSTSTPSLVPIQVAGDSACPLSNVAQVSAGNAFLLALQSDGTVCGLGSDNYGQLANATTSSSVPAPVKVTKQGGGPLTGVVQVSAGYTFAMALDDSGQVWAWGDNGHDQLGLSGSPTSTVAKAVPGLGNCSAVAAGQYFATALCSVSVGGQQVNEVFAWGDDTYGELGNGLDGVAATATPSPVESSSGAAIGAVTAIAAGGNTALALMPGGGVDSWGRNNYGQLGDGNTPSQQADSKFAGAVQGLPAGGAVALAEGQANGSYVVGLGGTVYAFGSDMSGQFGDGITNSTSDGPIVVGSGATEVVSGGSSTLEAYPSGEVVAFGGNANGQLGIGTTANADTPQVVSGVSAAGSSLYSSSYTYNGDGLRMSESVAEVSAQFTWDSTSSTPQLLSDADTSGRYGNYYLYGPDGTPVEQIGVSSGTTSYYFHDELGSTRALLSSTGKVAGTYSYDPNGAMASSWGTATTPILFAGGYLDGATGLYYLVHRYYDPTTGQFVSVDPKVDTTQESYGYAGGDPVNASDPSGLGPELFGIPLNPCDLGNVCHHIHNVANGVRHGVASVGHAIAGALPTIGRDAMLVGPAITWVGGVLAAAGGLFPAVGAEYAFDSLAAILFIGGGGIALVGVVIVILVNVFHAPKAG